MGADKTAEKLNSFHPRKSARVETTQEDLRIGIYTATDSYLRGFDRSR